MNKCLDDCGLLKKSYNSHFLSCVLCYSISQHTPTRYYVIGRRHRADALSQVPTLASFILRFSEEWNSHKRQCCRIYSRVAVADEEKKANYSTLHHITSLRFTSQYPILYSSHHKELFCFLDHPRVHFHTQVAAKKKNRFPVPYIPQSLRKRIKGNAFVALCDFYYGS